MNETSRRIIRGVCVYDILSTLGMAVPGVSVVTIGLYASLHHGLGLGGEFPEFGPTHQLFVNCTAMLVFFWCLVRLVLLDRLIVICDICARLYLTSLILYYVFAEGVSRVFFVFAVAELVGAVLEGWALKRA